MKSLIAQYFDNNKGQPLKVDPDHIFQDVRVMKYRYRYQSRTADWLYKKRSCWTTRPPREFINFFKKHGLEICIFDFYKKAI